MEMEDISTAPGSTNITVSRKSRQKRKSNLHNPHERKNYNSTMDKNPFIQNTYVRWERILGKIPHRSNYLSTEYRERLAGGADKDVVGGNKIVPQTGANKVTPNGSLARFGLSLTRESQILSHNYSKGISDKNVDEMIDCAIKNLQEAGKALVTLGENHEHELKLMVMDILAKFQKWIDVVQKKIDAAKYDVTSIRKVHGAQTRVLTEKDRELAALQAKLAECKAEKAVYKKALTDNQSKLTRRQSTHHDASVQSSQTSSHHLHSRATVHPGVLGSQLGVAEVAEETPTLSDVRTASHRTAISFSAPLGNGQNTTNAIDIDKRSNNSSSWITIARKLSRGQIHVSDNPEKVPSSSHIATHGSNLPSESVSILEPIDKPQQKSVQSRASMVPIEQHPTPSPSVRPLFTSAGTATDNAAVRSVSPHAAEAALSVSSHEGNAEGESRIVKLEAELLQLRNENEKMKRDHVEYENSVQRALLQGVSSLNAEALRVLKRPPFTCYQPCEPCNSSQSPSPAIIGENVPCILQAPDNHMSQGRGRCIPSKIGPVCYTHEDGVHSSLRRQAASVCYTPAKKLSQNSMLLLLPQQHIDCACTAVLQEYCVGSNYGRAGKLCPRDRLYCAPRAAAGRVGLRGGPMKTYTRALDRCDQPCNRN